MEQNRTLPGLLAIAAGMTVLSAIASPQAMALPALSIRGNIPFTTAQAPRPPFPLDGKPVYVSKGNQWLAARLGGYNWDSRSGFRYSVIYTNNNSTEQGVTSDRIITLAEAQRRNIATSVYDLSSQAGVNQMLNAHNSWRQRYKVPSLTWSPQLASYAQEWANTLLRTNRFEHRRNLRYGENLAAAFGQQFTPEQVVKMWGDEVKDYNYASNSCRPGKMCGHFTQIVWKNTRQVGCGMARNARREVWVCNYNPPGNVIGQKPY